MSRKLLLLIFFCWSGFVFGHNMEHIKNFGSNPGHLRLYAYIPDGLDPGQPAPLVLILHGSGQTALSLSRVSGFNRLADSLGFIAAYPDQPFYNNLLTAFSFYLPGKMGKDRGETASIRNMIDYLVRTYAVDSTRIFITGMSAGGAMSNVMLNAYPDLFEAGALIAAPSMLHADINPERFDTPRIAIIQGETDMTVRPLNANRLMAQWREYHTPDNEPACLRVPLADHPDIRITEYEKQDRVVLVRMDIAHTGHLLLVDPGDGAKQGGHYSLYSKDIDFHLPYWICEFFGLTENPIK